MLLKNDEVIEKLSRWLNAWNEHNLEAVVAILHDNVVFENWDGQIVKGKQNLRKIWAPWFMFHGNFNFICEDAFFSEKEQKLVFQWVLEWPSLEAKYKGDRELRKGIDIIHFNNGEIILKSSYSKTEITINGRLLQLHAV